jgi:hypothetical protein
MPIAWVPHTESVSFSRISLPAAITHTRVESTGTSFQRSAIMPIFFWAKFTLIPRPSKTILAVNRPIAARERKRRKFYESEDRSKGRKDGKYREEHCHCSSERILQLRRSRPNCSSCQLVAQFIAGARSQIVTGVTCLHLSSVLKVKKRRNRSGSVSYRDTLSLRVFMASRFSIAANGCKTSPAMSPVRLTCRIRRSRTKRVPGI